MFIIKRSLVVLMAGLLAFLVWVGLPLEIFGVALQVIHITTLLLTLIFATGRLLTGNWELFSMERSLFLRTLGLNLSFIFLLLVSLLSSFNAQNLFEVVKFEINYLVALVVIIIFIGVLKKESDIKFVLNCLLYGCILVALVTFSGFLVPAIGVITINQHGRAQGLMLHPNQWGMMLAAVLPLAASRLVINYRRLDRWFVLVLLAVSLALSGSKTNIFLALVFSAGALLIVSFLNPDLFLRLRAMFVMVVIVTLAVFVAFVLLQALASDVIEKLRIVLADPMEYRTVISRREKWADAITLVQQAPLFGIGAGNTREYLDTTHAHNAFVDYYLTMGLFGVIGLLFFLGCVINICWYVWCISKQIKLAHRAEVISLILGILSFILSNQFSNSFRGTTMPLMWVLLGVILAQANLWLRQSASSSPNKRRS